MFLVYIPTVVIVLFYVLYYYFTRTFNYWKKRNVVGPEPVPFFGNIRETALRTKNVVIAFKELYDMFPNEKVVGIYRMTTPCLLVRDLDIIKHIMIKDFDLFRDRGIELSSKGLGNNLFHTDSDTWGILRSRFNPIFTPGKLKNMCHLLNERANVFINHLEIKCRTISEYEVHSLTQKYTISAIFACAFGVDFDAFETGMDDILKYVDKMATTPNFAGELDMMYPGILRKLNLSIFPTAVSKFFKKLVDDIFTQRKGKPSDRGDFMDLILTMKQTRELSGSNYNRKGTENKSLDITDEIIAAQAFVFYVAGYETSATAMGYLLYELALNTHIQDKLRKDIDNVVEAHNGELTYDSLNEMKYLEKVFSETLRKHTLVDPLQRKAKVNYKIQGTDVVIKKDQIVLVSATGIHHDEKYYPNPEVFDPDRFDPDLVRARHPCAYLPFGIGLRNCIGLRFASLQSRVCIAKIISKFQVKTCEKTEIPLHINPNRVLRGPKDGIYLNIIPREH